MWLSTSVTEKSCRKNAAPPKHRVSFECPNPPILQTSPYALPPAEEELGGQGGGPTPPMRSSRPRSAAPSVGFPRGALPQSLGASGSKDFQLAKSSNGTMLKNKRSLSITLCTPDWSGSRQIVWDNPLT